MTTTAVSAAAASSLSPTAARLWRRSRWLLAAALVLLLAALVIAGIAGGREYPPLDPRSAAPDGARAITRLLQQQGVTVDTTTADQAIDDDVSTTFLVIAPETLGMDRLSGLRSTARERGDRIVLLAPGPAELSLLSTGTRVATASHGAPLTIPSASTGPDCGLPEAARAGSAELGGLLYEAAPGSTACYPSLGKASLIRTREGTSDTVVLGSGRFLTNDRLDDDGNASLALGLLGAHPRLVWYLPDYDTAAASGQGNRSLFGLLPGGWRWGLAQAGVAALLAALWRIRRLGPVVAENLPVVVRAAETTEGRARLYRRSKARGRAADALRGATRSRLISALGIPARPYPDPAAVTAAVAARLSGDRTPAEVHTVLYGAAPADDGALLRLADELDTLERQVRQP